MMKRFIRSFGIAALTATAVFLLATCGEADDGGGSVATALGRWVSTADNPNHFGDGVNLKAGVVTVIRNGTLMVSYDVDDEGPEDVHVMYTATYTPENPDSSGAVDITVVSRYPEDTGYAPPPGDTFTLVLADVTATSCNIGPDFDEDGLIDTGLSIPAVKSGSATASFAGTWSNDTDLISYMGPGTTLKAGSITEIGQGRYISVYTVDNSETIEKYMHTGTFVPEDPDESFTLMTTAEMIYAEGDLCPSPTSTYQIGCGDIWGSGPEIFTDTDSSGDAGYMEMDLLCSMARQSWSMPDPVGSWISTEPQEGAIGDGLTILSGATINLNSNMTYSCSYEVNDGGDSPVPCSHAGTYTTSGYAIYATVTGNEGDYSPPADTEIGWVIWRDSAGTVFMGTDMNDPGDGIIDSVIEVIAN